jgi:hypothetical protein
MSSLPRYKNKKSPARLGFFIFYSNWMIEIEFDPDTRSVTGEIPPKAGPSPATLLADSEKIRPLFFLDPATIHDVKP